MSHACCVHTGHGTEGWEVEGLERGPPRSERQQAGERVGRPLQPEDAGPGDDDEVDGDDTARCSHEQEPARSVELVAGVLHTCMGDRPRHKDAHPRCRGACPQQSQMCVF